ncbi:MAG: CPBP family intramembrane glutamic endopeptidase [Terriglobia bacterium]
MPIKLTSTEHKTIVMVALISALSLGIGAKYFWRAFPEASIDFRVNRDDSRPLAEKFLAERGIRVDGYRHTAVFDFDDSAKVYVERTQGLERMNSLTRGPLHLWRWSHRWFMPQQQEEYRIDVTPAGEVVRFDHEIPEAAPGANLEATTAQGLAEDFLRRVMKRDLADLEFVEGETEKRPARTDHTFTWKQKSVDLGDGSLRISVEIDGDQVAGCREFVKVPEQWSRDYEKLRSRNQSAQLVAEVFFILLTVAMLVILVLRLRDRDVPLRLSAWLGLVATLLYFLGQMNNYPMAVFGYRTTDSFSSFVAGYLQRSLLSALGVGAFIFFLTAGSEPVYREGLPGLASLRRTFTWQGLRSRSFFMANIVGIGLTFFFFAYQTIFYLAANKLGAWAPSDVNYSDLLSTRIPWVWVLFIGFLPAVSEELQFRAFAIPFLNRLFRYRFIAIVMASFLWGFLHSAYPNQPFFIRGVEVGVGGVIISIIMLRFGILATLIWHYSVDALYTAFLLLRSPNHYLMISGAITAGIMLVPLAISLLAYLRTGTFSEESALTNASEGVCRPERKEAVAVTGARVDYAPLDTRRLWLAAAMAAAFAGLTLLPVARFGDGIRLNVTRQGALRAADDFLRQKQVEPGRYQTAAILRENVDPLAVRYLLENRTVQEADRIYRHATRLLLWQVRYFRPLEKEEHLVYIDPTTGRAFNYRHVLDEDAPGATLSSDEARTRAAEFLKEQGYQVEDYDPQDAVYKKRKGRADYSLVWQSKDSGPSGALTVKDAHFRVEVDVAGDQVVGLSRYFKLPEEWQRRRQATTLANVVLFGAAIILGAGLAGGGILLFVRQIRHGEIHWRPAGVIGALVAIVFALAQLNQLPRFYQAYDTSQPMTAFWVAIVASLVIVPIVAGLLACLLIGLATSLYPQALMVFQGIARHAWRRDAAVAAVLSLAAAAGLSRLGDFAATHFHTVAPVRIEIVPDFFDALWPGAAYIFRGTLYAFFLPAIVGGVVYLLKYGLERRAIWVWLLGVLVLLSVGPSRAHSGAEYLAGGFAALLQLLVAVAFIVFFFRDNVLAYVAAAFCLPLAEPLVSLLTQPAAFFRLNGALLAVFVCLVLAWMFLARGQPSQNSEAAGG